MQEVRGIGSLVDRRADIAIRYPEHIFIGRGVCQRWDAGYLECVKDVIGRD